MTNKKNPQPSGSRRKFILGTAIVLVIIAAIGGGTLYKNHNDSTSATTEKQATVNYEPATEEEKQQVDENKDRIVKENESANTPPKTTSTGKKAVVPTITNTSGSINAYVSGIFEEGGTCTATFTKDGTTLAKSSAGFQNVSYTQCAPISISGFLSPGRWSVVLAYISADSEGTSAAQTFEVN